MIFFTLKKNIYLNEIETQLLFLIYVNTESIYTYLNYLETFFSSCITILTLSKPFSVNKVLICSFASLPTSP